MHLSTKERRILWVSFCCVYLIGVICWWNTVSVDTGVLLPTPNDFWDSLHLEEWQGSDDLARVYSRTNAFLTIVMESDLTLYVPPEVADTVDAIRRGIISVRPSFCLNL
jgi:hypothetical protein